MKKASKIFASLSFVVLLLVSGMLPAFAAKDELTINEKAKAKAGDTVSYTLYMGDCKEELEGIQMYIMYDSSYLKIDEGSLEFPNLPGTVSNAKLDGIVPFTWSNVQELADFSKKQPIISLGFEVKKAGTTKITYFIQEMYGEDITYLKSFTLTSDVEVNGKKVIDNETPIIVENGRLRNKYQGSFTNYADGKGEENGKGKQHVAVTGVTETPTLFTTTPEATEVTKGDSGSMDLTLIIVILVVALVVVGIVIIVILRKHYTS